MRCRQLELLVVKWIASMESTTLPWVTSKADILSGLDGPDVEKFLKG